MDKKLLTNTAELLEHHDFTYGCRAIVTVLLTFTNAKTRDRARQFADLRHPLHQSELEHCVEQLKAGMPGFYLSHIQIVEVRYDL